MNNYLLLKSKINFKSTHIQGVYSAVSIEQLFYIISNKSVL